MKKQLLILTLAALLLAGCGATSAVESTVPAQSESAAAAETLDTAEATPGGCPAGWCVYRRVQDRQQHVPR